MQPSRTWLFHSPNAPGSLSFPRHNHGPRSGHTLKHDKFRQSREQHTVGQESSVVISRWSRGTRRRAAAGRQRWRQQVRLANIRRKRGDERRGREQRRGGTTGDAVLIAVAAVALLPLSSFDCSEGALSAFGNKCDTQDESPWCSSSPRSQGMTGYNGMAPLGGTEGRRCVCVSPGCTRQWKTAEPWAGGT